MRTWQVISIIVENKPQAHQKVHLHTIKVYNTRPVSLCWVRFFFSSTEVFTCSKVINSFKREWVIIKLFQAIEFVDRPVLEKLWLRSRNDSYSQFPRSPLGTPGTPTPFCVLNTKKNGLQIMNLAAYPSDTNNSSLRCFSSHRQDALSASLPTSHHRLNQQPR